ncbi:hypothetical protein [Actinoplanes sp. DH11]|uniref:hypothetical protein n=1 Tax=Actinoplanes sp. DH11 TaxID=2857011 RepID=UPI001E64A369|nr:hypothetical protein [Actinoplanes sp. DH11]
MRLIPFLAVRGPWLDSDVTVVHRALRHYHANPAHRVELTGEAAVDRVTHDRLFPA